MRSDSAKTELRYTPDTFRVWLLVAAFAYAPLGKFVRGVFYNIPFARGFSAYAVTALFLILIALNIKTILHVITGWDVLAGAVFLMVIIASYLLYPENSASIEENLPELFLRNVPFYFVGLLWKDDREMFHTIFLTSVISLILNLPYFVFFLSRKEEFVYSMSTAYAMLPPVLVCAWWMMSETRQRVLAAAAFATGVFLLLFLGTRGPLVILVVYLVVLLWNRSQTRGRILLIVGAIALIGVMLGTDALMRISRTLSHFASRYGFSTRIFDHAQDNDFFSNTSGRDEFYRIVSEKIRERPLLGYGIYGEWQFIHNPAHRIWLEIWAHYGVILGSVLMIGMIAMAVRAIRSARSEYMRGFIVIWTVHLAVRGVFGSSYLGFYSFLLWGLCQNQIRRAQRDRFSPVAETPEPGAAPPLKEGL